MAAALSGGGDSVALVHVLAELAAAGHIAFGGVVHLNHRLRPPTSDEDERFCRDLADRLGLPCVVESQDVAALASTERISIEQAGHRARHALFERAAEQLEVSRVAVAHTMDDQAETVLLRLLRGAGTSGMSAMRRKTGVAIRPLLDVRRDDLRRYLAEQQAGFREDASNLDRSVPRNRVRHELLPKLREYSPRVVEALAREADIARLDEDYLAGRANELAGRLVQATEGALEIDVEGLAAAHPALVRRVVRDVLSRVSGRSMGFEQVERLRWMATDREPPPLDLPGCRAERVGDRLRLTARDGRGDTAADGPFDYRLDVPGTVSVPEAGVSISAEVVDAATLTGDESQASDAVVVAVSDGANQSLVVRNWRPGDRFRPIGLGGHRKKLQDLFVDRKVPRADRTRIPLVLDRDERIIWVVGQGVSDDFRVTTGATSVLVLKARPLGEFL